MQDIAPASAPATCFKRLLTICLQGMRTRQRVQAAQPGPSTACSTASTLSGMPIDIWENILVLLAQTDMLRSADVATRDIAAAACACRTANEAAGAGWRALLPADPTYREQAETEDTYDTYRFRAAAQAFHQVLMRSCAARSYARIARQLCCTGRCAACGASRVHLKILQIALCRARCRARSGTAFEELEEVHSGAFAHSLVWPYDLYGKNDKMLHSGCTRE